MEVIKLQRAVTTARAEVPAGDDYDVVVCHELQAADDADSSDPPSWLVDPVRYRSPYACAVPTALICRRVR